MPRGKSRTYNPSPGDVFGYATFLGETTVRYDGKYSSIVRVARMRCVCGNEYSAQVRQLYKGYGDRCSQCRTKIRQVEKLQSQLDAVKESLPPTVA